VTAVQKGDLPGARAAGLDPKEAALLELIDTVTQHADRVTDDQVQDLRGHGWSDEQIFEAVWVAAAFAYMTRVVDAFGIHWEPSMLSSGALGPQKVD
jgi:alkylhydroperoxidase family enzyme